MRSGNGSIFVHGADEFRLALRSSCGVVSSLCGEQRHLAKSLASLKYLLSLQSLKNLPASLLAKLGCGRVHRSRPYLSLTIAGRFS